MNNMNNTAATALTSTTSDSDSEARTIVLAWVEEVEVWDGRPFAADLGAAPGMLLERRASACIWLNAGVIADVIRAEKYAEREGHSVFTYPTTEPNPLARAKCDILVA